MWRKCDTCLCRTCLNTCCDRKNCKGKIEKCKRYSGFRQLSIFETPKPQRKKAPRYPWEYYDIDKKRYKELTAMMRSKMYDDIMREAAYETDKDIAEYILLSVMEKRSYEGVEYAEWLGRIPCGRTDFYGYRRAFYAKFNEEMKRIGK